MLHQPILFFYIFLTVWYIFQDNSNNKVILGISINGIMVSNTHITQFYRWLVIYYIHILYIVIIYIQSNISQSNCVPCRWKDIHNVINHKKTFRIECQGEEVKQFSFTESRDAKYIWRLCVAQHTFYMQQERQPERPQGCFVRKWAFWFYWNMSIIINNYRY